MSKKKQVQLDEQFLSVQKAASFLDVSANTIRRWAQLGKLKGVKIGSRGDWRFTKNNLLQMVIKVTG
jgi:excisionase family DNA binding protein